MDTDVGQYPVPLAPRRRLAVGVIAVVGALVVGLIVWFFVVSRPGANTGNPGPRPVPDILTQPRWSDPIDFPDLYQVGGVVDPQSGDIAIVWGSSSKPATSPDAIRSYVFQAVNLATGARLWSVTRDAAPGDQPPELVGTSGFLTITTLNILPGTQGSTAQFESVDARTGKSLGTVTLAEKESVYVGAGMAFTSGDAGTCARDLADPSVCRWKTSGAMWVPPGDNPVFGGGRWVSTNAGVLDVRTGKPAGFGSDGALYAGPDPDHIVRLSWNDRTIQPWDPANDRGLSVAATFHSSARPYAIDPASSRLVATVPGIGPDDGVVVTSYGWNTGQQWQTTLDWAGSFLTTAVCATTVVVQSGSSPDRPGHMTALALGDGRQLWDSGPGVLMGTGQRVVYTSPYGGATKQLDAYDAASGDFAHLWSLDWPPRGVNIIAAAGRLVAFSTPLPQDPSTGPGHLWVLAAT